MSIINAWKPEEDVVLHQALGKLAEECSELAKIATRCMIQGYAEADPATEKPNSTALMEEAADVRAAMRWLFDVLDIPFKGESPREARKFDGFKRWESMLRAAPDNRRCQNCDGYNCDDGCAYPEPTTKQEASTSEKQDIAALETQLKHLITTRPNKAALAAFDNDTRMWFIAQLTGIASGCTPLTDIEQLVARHLPLVTDDAPVN